MSMAGYDVATSQEFHEVVLSSDATITAGGVIVAAVRFPANANCFLVEDAQLDSVVPLLDEAARRAGRRAICCDLRLISRRAASLVPRDRDVTLVAAGSGALDLASTWEHMIVRQEIDCVFESRHRESRRIRASEVVSAGPVVVFDDVAVSGVTLSSAVAAIRTTGKIEVLVGMAFASRRMRERVRTAGAAVFHEVVRYSRVGGGRTPINSLSTLRRSAQTRHDLATRYFGGPYALDFLAVRDGRDA